MKVVVEWNMDPAKPQMTSRLEFAKGTAVLDCDQIPIMGGQGRAVNPIQYCLLGTATCFAGTFAAVAAEKNIEIGALTVAVENKMNLSQPLGLSEEPTVEGVSVTVNVESSAPAAEIEECQRLALARCPGIYCITRPIPLEALLVTAAASPTA